MTIWTVLMYMACANAAVFQKNIVPQILEPKEESPNWSIIISISVFFRHMFPLKKRLQLLRWIIRIKWIVLKNN